MPKHTQSVSIVVADDHPIVLSGLIMLLKQNRWIEIVASCVDGVEAINAIRSLKPDIALLDMKMPSLNGLQVLETITSEAIATRVILLAATLSDDEIVAAAEANAYGIILKESAPDVLTQCVNACAAGQKWLPTELVDEAFERVRNDRSQILEIAPLLTRREIEIMLKVAEGFSNKDVGRQLNITEGTVKMHLHSIYQKVGVGNRTSLANFTIANRSKLDSNLPRFRETSARAAKIDKP